MGVASGENEAGSPPEARARRAPLPGILAKAPHGPPDSDTPPHGRQVRSARCRPSRSAAGPGQRVARGCARSPPGPAPGYGGQSR